MSKNMRTRLLSICLAGLVLAGCGSQSSLSPEEAKEKLKSAGVEFNEKNFVEASFQGNSEQVALFLKAGMSPDSLSGDDWTALMWASRKGNVELVDLLLKAGADLNIRQRSPFPTVTALSIAMEDTGGGHPKPAKDEIVALLKEAGAKE